MKIVIGSREITEVQKMQIRNLLREIGWNQRQIDGQIETLEKFVKDKNCIVLYVAEEDEIVGYISAQLSLWNRLGQIHGLAIQPGYRKKGYASTLVKKAEEFMLANHARGLYADTPVDNVSGCAFYRRNGFQEAYIMPEYYDRGLDGVTFLKLFKK